MPALRIPWSAVDYLTDALWKEDEPTEWTSGLLPGLKASPTSVRDTMLRISGAIQVLEELLAQAGPIAPAGEQPNGGIAGRTS